jgi:hypothetical protein
MALLTHAALDSSLRESALAILLVLCSAMIVSAARLTRGGRCGLCHTDPFTVGVGNRGGMSGAGGRCRSDANGCGLDEV